MRNGLLVGWLFFVLFAGLPANRLHAEERQVTRKETKITEDYLQGVRYWNMGALQHAALMFERVIKADPNHAAAYYKLSEIAEAADEDSSALEYARKAYTQDPSFRKYAEHYARQLFLTEQYEKAEEVYLDLLRKDSTSSEVVGILSLIRFNQNRNEEVLTLIDTLEKQMGVRPPLVDIKRQALIRMQRYQDAYDYMDWVTDEVPDQPGFHIYQAELAAALRYDSAALAHYHAAIELDSTALAGLFSLAEYYRIKEVLPEFYEALIPVIQHPDWPAREKMQYLEFYVWTNPDIYRSYLTYMIRLADALLQSDPEDIEIERFYVRHLIYSGQPELAHEYLVRKIDEGDADVETYCQVIEMAQYRELPDTTAKYMELAQARFPENERLMQTLLYVQYNQEDTLDAMETAQWIIRHTENDTLRSSMYGTYGDLAHSLGKKKEAFKSYEKALKINPDNPVVLNNFAYYLSLEKKQLKRALEMSTRANELDQQNPVYLDTQAWILYEMGRYEEAQVIMRQALVLDKTNNSELLLHFGDISEALGQHTTAETYWRRALEAGADGAEIEKRLGVEE